MPRHGEGSIFLWDFAWKVYFYSQQKEKTTMAQRNNCVQKHIDEPMNLLELLQEYDCHLGSCITKSPI